jgi:hypothetical protein
MKTISFNTKRTYSDKGQRIACAMLKDGTVIMLDIDRGLDYAFPPNIYGDNQLSKTRVMDLYDWGTPAPTASAYPNELKQLQTLAEGV